MNPCHYCGDTSGSCVGDCQDDERDYLPGERVPLIPASAPDEDDEWPAPWSRRWRPLGAPNPQEQT